MFRVKIGTIPVIFRPKFHEISHQYPTRFCQNSFKEKPFDLKQTKFAISSRGPRLWNKILHQNQKSILYEASFKREVKNSLFHLQNEVEFF